MFDSIVLRMFLIALVLSFMGASLCAQKIRIATFNTSLYRKQTGQLAKELETANSNSAKKIAEILQVVRPDIVLLNEFDRDPKGKAIEFFRKHYLEVSQNGKAGIEFPFVFLPNVNTGVPSGMDLDGDGKTNGPADSFGFGNHPGQYGLAVLSRFPIDLKATRTFQKFLWKDMPGARLPRVKDGKSFYSSKILDSFRLSSKTHCDVVIRLKTGVIHVLAAHPTPPVFDGEEDRNGCRNHDEIRFWSDYVSTDRSDYIYDDRQAKGGLGKDSRFVILGDLNADPNDGDSTGNPIGLFKRNRRINFVVTPKSSGAVEASKTGKANRKHRGDPALDTADFNDATVGNLRIDYVLPSANLTVKSSGVFWPKSGEKNAKLVSVSDHRLVWIDIALDD